MLCSVCIFEFPINAQKPAISVPMIEEVKNICSSFLTILKLSRRMTKA